MILSQRQEINYFERLLPRTDLIDLIPNGAKRILDVGCGAGKTGQVLWEKGFKEVYGMEVNFAAADQARPFYREVHVCDIEKGEIPFPEKYFDCILYGDVLEHLLDPWGVLKKHREILRDDGVIICSIPNIRYYKILKSLVFKGQWEYTDLGILDRTHLRFFTLKTIEDMFYETGFEIQKIIKKKRCRKALKVINRLIFNRLIDFLVMQYRIVGIKTNKFLH